MYTLSEIFIYPVKALPGISVHSAHVTSRGLKHDRRWMIIDSNNRFISLRTHPKLTQLITSLEYDWITVAEKRDENRKIRFEAEPIPDRTEKVTVWESECDAVIAEKEINDWFSKFLTQPVRLAYMHDKSYRTIDNNDGNESKIVSFADSYPFLMIGETSLENLNEKLQNDISILRFRPNFVFSGGLAHEEDSWQNISIGDVDFTIEQTCGRCRVINIDPETGELDDSPTRALKSYRMKDNNIHFGVHMTAGNQGQIKAGYKIELD